MTNTPGFGSSPSDPASASPATGVESADTEQPEVGTTVGCGLAPVLALVGLLGVAAARRRLGPRADWVETLRWVALPPIDSILERTVGGSGSSYELSQREFVASVEHSPEALEKELWDLGCRRNLLAATKTVADGREAVGSWAYRGEELPRQEQVHIMLFAKEDGGTDIYSHAEYSSAIKWLWTDPTVLCRHYNAVEYSPSAGEEFVRENILPKL